MDANVWPNFHPCGTTFVNLIKTLNESICPVRYVRVPVRTLVLRHLYPTVGVGGLDIHRLDGASTGNIGHKHEIEVVVTVDYEPHLISGTLQVKAHIFTLR